MICIINYGLGNIHAFANIYKRLNIPAAIASTPQELHRAERIVLPGVGAFDWAMTRLNESGLRDALEEAVITDKKPVLGICVGMQMMANRSDEGKMQGLGWIEGEVKKFGSEGSGEEISLPQMGWNNVVPRNGACLFAGLENDARFYFLHSYYFRPASAEHILTRTKYHGEYASAVRSEHIYGVQFHPEKSHQWGIRLLKNFAEI